MLDIVLRKPMFQEQGKINLRLNAVLLSHKQQQKTKAKYFWVTPYYMKKLKDVQRDTKVAGRHDKIFKSDAKSKKKRKIQPTVRKKTSNETNVR